MTHTVAITATAKTLAYINISIAAGRPGLETGAELSLLVKVGTGTEAEFSL
jgi:hypothetical protein